MAEEFKFGDRVRIVRGAYKSKTGQIIGKVELPISELPQINMKLPQAVPLRSVELDGTGKIIALPEDDLEHIRG